jgi:mRNA interferase ChpB
MRIPKRGEIWQVNLSPAAGSEQQGLRPVLVITNKDFNQTGLMIVCPITQGGVSLNKRHQSPTRF